MQIERLAFVVAIFEPSDSSPFQLNISDAQVMLARLGARGPQLVMRIPSGHSATHGSDERATATSRGPPRSQEQLQPSPCRHGRRQRKADHAIQTLCATEHRRCARNADTTLPDYHTKLGTIARGRQPYHRNEIAHTPTHASCAAHGPLLGTTTPQLRWCLILDSTVARVFYALSTERARFAAALDAPRTPGVATSGPAARAFPHVVVDYNDYGLSPLTALCRKPRPNQCRCRRINYY